MTTLRKSIWDFVLREDGPTAVEYAVMLAMIILVCLGAIKSVGSRTGDQFNAIATGLTP